MKHFHATTLIRQPRKSAATYFQSNDNHFLFLQLQSDRLIAVKNNK